MIYYNVLILNDTNQRNSSLNEDAVKNGIGGKVASCSSLVDIPVGVADGNHSFGGICTMIKADQRSNVMICNDEMVGHFKIENVEPDKITREQLIKFVISNCYGG